MTTVTYTFSNTTAMPIPDAGDLSGTNPGAPVTTTILTAGMMSGSITNVSVELNDAHHTFVNDLRVTLTDLGTSVFVLDNDDGSKDLNGNYIFDDSATANFNTLPSASVIAPGTYHPHSNLAAFDGFTSADTSWSLTAQDFFSGDTGSVNGGWTLFITVDNAAPVIANPGAVVVATGTAPVSLGIAAPADADNDPLTITLTTLPGYGTLQFFDGTTWVTAAANDVVTAAELTSLRYTAPTSGEHGGDDLVYTVSDGVNTVTGTVDFAVETASAAPLSLFFPAYGGPGNLQHSDLYTLDSSGNPVPIPLNSPNGSFAGEDGGFFQYAGNLYFNADDGGGEFLFKMAPDGTVTKVADTVDSGFFLADNEVSANFVEFAGKLYFTAEQLGEVDADGTSQLITLNSSRPAFNGNLYGGFVAFDHSLYFSAFDDHFGGGTNAPDLIKLDADGTITAISTRASGNEASGSSAGEDGGFVVFNNALYFNAISDTLGDTLFRLDAGSTTPVAVDSTGAVLTHLDSGVNSAFHVYNDNLYFNEFSSALGGNTLFKLDTSGTLTPLSFGGDALSDAGSLDGMFDFAGGMFFDASTPSTGTALFELHSDGTITDVYDNSGAGAFDDNLVSGFAQFNGSLYFDAYVSGGSDALFRLDANGALTQLDLGGGPGTTFAGLEGGFQVVGDSMYFSAYTADGYELVRIDTTGAIHTYDINPGPNDSVPGNTDGTTGDHTGDHTFGAFPLTVLHGTAGADVIAGDSTDQMLDGGAGDDTLYGGTGTGFLMADGGDGNDTLILRGTGSGTLTEVVNVELLSVVGGTWTVTHNESYSGGVTVSGGDLDIEASLGTTHVAVASGGTVEGNGTVGNLSLVSGATFAEHIAGTTPGVGGYEQLYVVGTVDLTGATLDVSLLGGFHPTTGATFEIIDNDGSDSVTGTFAGLAEGATFGAGGASFSISYHGGDGNDVVLTALAPPPSNSAPTDITLSHSAVDENSPIGTVVGTLSDTDPDAGDSASFSLLNDAGGRFAIDGDHLVVANSIMLDYEQNASHTIDVQVTDSGGLTFDKVLTIGINDVNPETVGGTSAGDHIDGGALADNINGGPGDDFIVGGAGDDMLGGGTGNDTISGGDGNDTIWGESGHNVLGGNDGNDTIIGGNDGDIIGGDAGNDVLVGGDGNDTMFGGDGDDQISGGGGDDIIVGDDGNDTIWGNDGNDTINAGAGNDIVLGGNGNDQIGGGTGDDVLRGEAGNDVLWGEDGNDTLTGGPGDDVMIGGAGADTFVFSAGDGHDIITDFTPTGPQADHIWLAGTDLHSFADVVAHASFNPGTGATTITHNGTDSIVLNGVALAQLNAGDFLFS